MPRKAILIAGPTASGKSRLALRLARRLHGAIINADAMQVYRDLRVLSARPTVAEEGLVPHHLFGHVDGADAYSVGRWLADVEVKLRQCADEGRTPIIVGGTGLYFKALVEGLSPVPSIPAGIRQRWRLQAQASGGRELHAALAERDPAMACRLDPGDGQRIVRALEVLDATGRSLADWHRQPSMPLIDAGEAHRLVVGLDREIIRARRCDARFAAMLAGGALDEVDALAARQLDPGLPVMRAIGVRALLAAKAGRLTVTEAKAAGQLETRQYVKRQLTWLRRNMNSWRVIF